MVHVWTAEKNLLFFPETDSIYKSLTVFQKQQIKKLFLILPKTAEHFFSSPFKPTMVQVWMAKNINFFHCFCWKWWRKKLNLFSPPFFQLQQKFIFQIFCRLFLCKLVVSLTLPLLREYLLFEFNGMWWLMWQGKVDKKDIFEHS